MIRRKMTRAGIEVGAMGFGAWGIGGQWGPVEREQAQGAIRAARERGVDFFDTADAYGIPPGVSEEWLGAALKPDRREVAIATKVGNFARRAGHPLPFTSPLHVELCCDASLHRLGIETIDLYQCHIGSLREPDVFLEAFDTLLEKGKIRAYGISANDLAVVEAFDRDGRLGAVQLDYSILNRSAENDVLPYAAANGIGVIVRGPLAMGVLTGKFDESTTFDDSVRSAWNEGEPRERFRERVRTAERLRPLASEGESLAQLALRFAISRPEVTVAIPGAKSEEQARANAAAGDAALASETLAAIDGIVPPGEKR